MADENKRAAQYRNEAAQAQSPTPTPAERERMRREAEAAKQDAASKTAPTTRSEMGKLFKSGGFVRAADGIAKRGKTRGRMV
jgi:hypothetical protein